MKYFTKHVQVRNITHAKETICALLNTQEELLEALKDCEAVLRLVERETGKSYAAIIAARAAIAKATGE